MGLEGGAVYGHRQRQGNRGELVFVVIVLFLLLWFCGCVCILAGWSAVYLPAGGPPLYNRAALDAHHSHTLTLVTPCPCTPIPLSPHIHTNPTHTTIDPPAWQGCQHHNLLESAADGRRNIRRQPPAPHGRTQGVCVWCGDGSGLCLCLCLCLRLRLR